MLAIKSRLLLLVTLLPFAALAGGANLQPGYYLNKKGDTIKCNIELAAWNKNPSVVHVVLSSGPAELRPEDVKGFGVYGYADYVSANATYHTAKITGNDLPDKFSDEVETKWCFLKLLAGGTVSLYELQTSQRTVFFISDHGREPSELLYRVAIEDNHLTEDQHYKQILLRIFNNQGTGENYEGRIERISYNENDLLSLVKRINHASGINNSNGEGADFSYTVFAGGQAYLFPSAFNGAYSVNNHFSPSVSPVFGIGLFYNLTPYSGRFRLGLSADYSSYNASHHTSGVQGQFFSQNFYDTTAYSERLHGTNAFITFKAFLLYTLNPDAAVKFYLKAGVWYSFSIKKDADVSSDYTGTTVGAVNGIRSGPGIIGGHQPLLTISNSFGRVLTGLGVRLGNSQVEAGYSLPSYTGRFNGSGDKFKIGAVSLTYGYIFGKHK